MAQITTIHAIGIAAMTGIAAPRAASLSTTKWPANNAGSSYSPAAGQVAFISDRRHPDLCCTDLFVMRADGTQQHLVDTGLQGVLDVAWGTAPPVPAGSPGTLSRPPAATLMMTRGPSPKFMTP